MLVNTNKTIAMNFIINSMSQKNVDKKNIEMNLIINLMSQKKC